MQGPIQGSEVPPLEAEVQNHNPHVSNDALHTLRHAQYALHELYLVTQLLSWSCLIE